MNKQDYDKYYQQGDSYVIPVEIFNELFEDYECFKNDCKKYKEVIDKVKEWEQTHTILVYTKEAPRQFVGTHELLHILYDKEVE